MCIYFHKREIRLKNDYFFGKTNSKLDIINKIILKNSGGGRLILHKDIITKKIKEYKNESHVLSLLQIGILLQFIKIKTQQHFR
jgi:hypothetical protein